jgi:5'-nucleotidase (lipoprotein e(P4) family)
MELGRRAIIKNLGVGGLATGVAASSWLAQAPQAAAAADDPVQNILSAAVAWRETAAERDMLYRQGFNIARDRLDAVLRGEGQQRRGRKPLAFISDVDDTVLSSDTYWAMLIAAGKQAFDDAMWDDWVRANGPTATPGAVEFTRYAESRGVEIFYVSSRDQGENTQALGVGNLKHVGLAFADDAHATFFRGSSNKEAAQQAIAANYQVIAYLGDNLNDFRRKYYSTSVAQRKALANEDVEEFGRNFILFPNNTDGHWMRAIFGDSEPPDTAAYRARMLEAAKGLVP